MDRKTIVIILLLCVIGFQYVVNDKQSVVEMEQTEPNSTELAPEPTSKNTAQLPQAPGVKPNAFSHKAPKPNNPNTIGIETNEFDERNKAEDIISAANSRGYLPYKKIKGYPLVSEINKTSGCENLLDTELELALISPSLLSGDDIFISQYFCLDSPIWQYVNRVQEDMPKVTLKEQVKALQQIYDTIIYSTSDKARQVIYTQMFVNWAAKSFHLFPTRANGSEHYQLGVLVYWQRGARPTIRQRLNLFNSLDIPDYLFKDLLNNTMTEQKAQFYNEFNELLAEGVQQFTDLNS